MGNWKLLRPSPAMVVAVIALIAGLGGGAYAATLVTGAQIKNNSITGADIRNSSLTGNDIRNESLSGADVKNGSLQAADLSAAAKASLRAVGVAGASGPAGPQGLAGPPGAVGPSNTYAAFRASGTVVSGIGTLTTVTFFQVPAGSWLIQGNLVLTNTAAAAREVTCALSGGAGTIDRATTVLDAAGGLDTQTVALAGTVGPADSIFASLNCNASLAGVDFADGDLIATQVGTLNQIAPRP